MNPLCLRRTLESNIVMASSRSRRGVVTLYMIGITGIDGVAYLMLEMQHASAEIDSVLIDPGYLLANGAGEPSSATIVNAEFDANGLSMCHAPFTPQG